MVDEKNKKTLGLKEEDKNKPSPGNDQPDDGGSSDDEDTVKISKDELEKLKRDKENYKKGLLSLKEKMKASDDDSEPDKEPEKKQKGDFLTRKEYLEKIEREAIATACGDSDVNDNWKEIVKYYVPHKGRDTVAGITSDIKRAHKLFRLENPKEDDEGDKAESDLSADKGKPAGESKKSKEKKKEKNSSPNKKIPPSEWYK